MGGINKSNSRSPARSLSGKRVCVVSCLLGWLGVACGVPAENVDPLAANNGLYPGPEWTGPFRIPNMDYPRDTTITSDWVRPAGQGGLSPEEAPDYVAAVKEYLAESLIDVINNPMQWRPRDHGWYDIVWTGQGSLCPDGITTDPRTGLESLLASATGQIIPKEAFAENHRPSADLQVHQVTYFNEVAATLLGKVWANIYKPYVDDMIFPTGSIVVKVEATTTTSTPWSVVENGAEWHVYRPSVEAQEPPGESAVVCATLKPEVLTLRVLQLSVAIKDPDSAPATGWVFLAFTYDASSSGATPWDRFVPLGAQWGNDPQLTDSPSGRGANGDQPLTETWVNPDAPAFTNDTLGWGHRLSGPMDVATRLNVITVGGTRYGDTNLTASSCLSCHGPAEFPMTTNLYPSPNTSFPPDGKPFLLYDPGTPEWAQWFQNRLGSTPMSPNNFEGINATDYNWTLVFALMAYNAAFGNDVFVRERFDVH